MATVYGILEQNEGFVIARSGVGQGTTIEMYLPRYVADPDEATGSSDR